MMEERLKSLGLILERMEVLYQRAIDLLGREKAALVILDYEEIYRLFKEKDEVLTAIRALDKDRLKVQDLFAALNRKNPEDVTLKTLAEHLIFLGGDSSRVGQRLLALRNKLAETVEQLRQKIVLNQSFVEKSIENLQSIAEHLSANLVGRAHPERKKTNVYTGRGKIEQKANQSGGLLEKRL
jgi:flagellar biosynthesis/type III secretory pathway chaperone